MSDSIDRGIAVLIEGIRARAEGRSFEAPDLFVTSVRGTFAERVAVALARDSGGDVDALCVEARAASARDMLRCFAMCAGPAP